MVLIHYFLSIMIGANDVKIGYISGSLLDSMIDKSSLIDKKITGKNVTREK